MRLVFIGGTRFIGLEAVRQSAARGHQVWVLHRGVHSCALPRDVREVHVNRHDLDGLRRALHAIQPEAVVDTFAMTVSDAKVTVGALAGLRTSVVVLSSHDVYAQFGLLNGHPAPTPEALVTEGSPLTVPYPFRGLAAHAGGDDYDKKLVEGEFRAAIHGGKLSSATILRVPATYGSGDYQYRFKGFIDHIVSGKRKVPCQGGASWRWTMGHVGDVAHAILLAAESEHPGLSIYNVGEASTPTMRQRADAIAEVLGVTLKWLEEERELPEAFSSLGRAPADFVVDSSLIRTRLGYHERLSSREALLDLIGWCAPGRQQLKSNV